MYFETDMRPSYTGTERYAVSFQLREQDDLYDVQGKHVQYTIRPERVVMIWERTHRDGHFTPWVRRRIGRQDTESRIIGPRVLKDDSLSDKQESYVHLFRDEEVGGRLTEYAASLPHLPELVAEVESKLPA